MSAHRKLTDDQIAWVRYTMNRRRELLRQLAMVPTIEELAEQLECHKRYLQKILANEARIPVRPDRALRAPISMR